LTLLNISIVAFNFSVSNNVSFVPKNTKILIFRAVLHTPRNVSLCLCLSILTVFEHKRFQAFFFLALIVLLSLLNSHFRVYYTLFIKLPVS